MKSPARRVWILIAAVLLLIGAAAAVVLPRQKPQENRTPPRALEVLYLSTSHDPDLWVISPGGGVPRQLTNTGGKVFDYNVSPDGSKIVYSVQNEQKGIDLWEMDRQGMQAHLILPCYADWCINPAVAPDGKQIAYSRRQTELEGNEPGVPRLWMLDSAAGSTDAVYVDPNVGGFEPSWSPDGRYLAFFDGLSLGVRVLEVSSKTDFLLESQSGMVGEWSPDSKHLIYIDSMSGEELPSVRVHRVDVQTQQSQLILGSEQDPMDYSMPDWSPDGSWLAVALRSLTGSPSKQVWIMHPDGSQRQSVTSEQLFTHAAYHWSPDSQMLAFQRLELGASATRPQIAVWNRADGSITLLAEDAFQPAWLP